MALLNRIVLVVILLAVLAFCAFGFMATFEPPGWVGLRIGYAVVGALCLFGVARALLKKKPQGT